MKVKDLDFDSLGECGLTQFCNPFVVSSFQFLFIKKRTSRSYYLYAHQYGHEFPLANYRVSANDDVFSLLHKILS